MFVRLNTGYLVLRYGAGEGQSTFALSPEIYNRVMNAPNSEEVIGLIIRTRRYLLDEGFELGYNMPFKLEKDETRKIPSWQNEDDPEK